ncbi:hypothetical protein OSTOST_10180 [Ostertagia ostertagi]
MEHDDIFRVDVVRRATTTDSFRIPVLKTSLFDASIDTFMIPSFASSPVYDMSTGIYYATGATAVIPTPAYELIPHRVFVGGFPASSPEKLEFKGRKLNLGPALRRMSQRYSTDYAIATPTGLVQSPTYGYTYSFPPQPPFVMVNTPQVTPTVVAHPRSSPTNIYNSHMASVPSAPYFSTPDGHGVPYQQTFYYNNTPMAAAGDAANMQMMYGNGAPPAATPLYGGAEYTPPPTQQPPHDSPPIAQGLFTPSPHHGGTPQVVYEAYVYTPGSPVPQAMIYPVAAPANTNAEQPANGAANGTATSPDGSPTRSQASAPNAEVVVPVAAKLPATPPATAASSSVSVVTAPVPVQQPQPCIQYPVYLQPQAPPTPTFYYNNTPMAAAGDAANMQMMYGNGAPPATLHRCTCEANSGPQQASESHTTMRRNRIRILGRVPTWEATPQGGRFVRAAPRAVMSLNGQFQSMRVSNDHPKNSPSEALRAQATPPESPQF